MATPQDKRTLHLERARFRQALARIAKRNCDRGCGDMARYTLNHHGETPGDHFRRCRDCDHVEICAACRASLGFCPEHKDDPEASYSWAEG